MKRVLSILIAVALVVRGLAAQGVADKTKAAAADTTRARPGSASPARRPAPKEPSKTVTAAPTAPSLAGVVRFTNQKPVVGATVNLAGVEGSTSTRFVRITDSAGVYHIDSLPAGTYDLLITYPTSRSTTARITVGLPTWREDVLLTPYAERSPPLREILWTLVAVLLYYATILLVRWHNIGTPSRQLLKRRIDALRVQIHDTLASDQESAAAHELESTLQKLERAISKQYRGRRFVPELMFWSRGHVNATWFALHEVERELATHHATVEQVDVNLLSYAEQLHAIKKPAAAALAVAIDKELETSPAATEAAHQYRRALLERAIWMYYDDRDTEFSSLLEWQNKAAWLIMAALVFVLFLTIAVGNAVLFLAGAAGGFLSRLERTIRRDNVPLDYGASWTTLFLSPLLGALMGWFGIALITFATDERINLLGAAFRVVDWNHPRAPLALGIAFFFGFSERFFDSVVGALDGRNQADQNATSTVSLGGITPAGSSNSRPSPRMPGTPETPQTADREPQRLLATAGNAPSESAPGTR